MRDEKVQKVHEKVEELKWKSEVEFCELNKKLYSFAEFINVFSSVLCAGKLWQVMAYNMTKTMTRKAIA